MLDRNDKKYILRRILTYIAIAIIMFLISSCQAKAYEIGDTCIDSTWRASSCNLMDSSGSRPCAYDYGRRYYNCTSNNVIVRIPLTMYISGGDTTALYSAQWVGTFGENNEYTAYGQASDGFIEFYVPKSYALLTRIGRVGYNTTAGLIELSNHIIVYNEKVDETAQAVNDLNNNIISEDGPTNSYDFVGYLPPGPLDSILNLPLQLLNVVGNKLGSSCTPLTLTIPFINESITLPCLWVYLSDNIPRLSSILTWVSVVADIYILYHYLMYTYKWVDDTLTLRENNQFGGFE